MYSLWASKKRANILSTLGIIFFVALGTYVIVRMYKPPTCFDQKLNQDELAIDCGGVCKLMCASQVSALNTVWARAFQVTPGLWSALAYVENPNVSAEVYEATYKFTFFDRNNEIIVEREGSTFITHEAILPVFEGRIAFEEKVPYKTKFEWTGTQAWTRLDAVYTVAIEEQQLLKPTTQPEIKAVLVNKDPFPLTDIEVVVIVFDANDNAIGVSKTYVDRISARGKSNISFSWSSPFEAKPERWQLVARVPQQRE